MPPRTGQRPCDFFSKPGGCRHGDTCRFKHVSEIKPSPPQDSAALMNNKSPPPDYSLINDTKTTYKRDTKYYYPDDMGVFLVEETLFRVRAREAFGPRPTTIPAPIKGISPMYVEDVLPRLLTSSDNNPIALSGVTVDQFKNYLLAITCRPGDPGYSTFATGYNEYWGSNRLKEVYTLYVDIATLARLFGTVRLEEWAMNTLHSIFSNPHSILTLFASQEWTADSIFHLRTLSRNTGLERPAMRFIQYCISINLKEGVDPSSANARACVGLYDMIKHSETDSVLLGCLFLSLLALGHQSRIWKESMNRKDKAILYAAQVQLVNAAKELKSLGWLKPEPPSVARGSGLCNSCEKKTVNIWKEGFGQLGKDLGSGLPFKDVSVLSQVAKTHWEFHEKWKDGLKFCCGYAGRCLLLSPTELPGFLDDNIRKLYEEMGTRYKQLASET